MSPKFDNAIYEISIYENTPENELPKSILKVILSSYFVNTQNQTFIC